ncbi:uncharacterized protein LOC119743593 [Patiria miniata]|uniref:Apple domain-containing protein n=1 Tax=Patiria miniata TaxID=46514 RepID=A0A914BIK7_PATMI|nr:uncharacterized protein LOC119743593 [Patiria miniata]
MFLFGIKVACSTRALAVRRSVIGPLLLVLLCDVVRCDDLSTTCPRYGQLLQGHTLRTHSEWSPLACAGMCTQYADCQSYSFCSAEEQCHLHNATALQYPGDVVESENCTHYKMTREPRSTQHQSTSKNVACNPSPYEFQTPGSRFKYKFVFPQFIPDHEVFLMFFSVRCAGSGYIAIGPDYRQVFGNYYTITLGPGTMPLFFFRKMTGSSLSTLHYCHLTPPLSDTQYHHYWLAYVQGNILMGKRGKAPFLDKKDSSLWFTPVWPAIASDKGCDWVFHSMANLQLCKVCSGS